MAGLAFIINQDSPPPTIPSPLPQTIHPPSFFSQGVGAFQSVPPSIPPTTSPFPLPFFPEDYEDIITSSTTTCALCGQIGHFAYECAHMIGQNEQPPTKSSIAPPSKRAITPYQGNRRLGFYYESLLSHNFRCFGEYRCKACDRKWMSGNSWANSGQACKKCRIMKQLFSKVRFQQSMRL